MSVNKYSTNARAGTFLSEPEDVGLPPLTLVRRKRQRTMRIRVKDDAIIVSGPATVSERRLLQFANEKEDWIRSACLRRHEKVRRLRQKQEQMKGTLLLRGIRKHVYDFPVPGLRKAILEEHDQAVVYRYNPLDYQPDMKQLGELSGHVENGAGTEDEAAVDAGTRTLAGAVALSGAGADTAAPQPGPDLVRQFYRAVAKKELTDRYNRWKDKLPFTPVRLSIRNQRTKWGSCSARGTISLNWRLIKCPPSIMDYIIIHELCHLRHFNHSRDFWETVRQYCPDVRSAKKWIRENSDEIFADF